jgi:hypothetical protein
MAFTSPEATKIRRYLGYPSVFKYEDPRLEGVIVTVGQDADAVAEVQQTLADVDAVRAQLRSVALVSTGVKSLDKGDVELYADNQQSEGLRALGRTFCAQLSEIFGVPLANDFFGTKGYRDDAWMGAGRGTFTGLAGMG